MATDSLLDRNGRLASLSDETIEKLCTSREGALQAAITEAFPEVKASGTRNKPDGYCTAVFKVET